ncbi:MFS transporter [Asaia platycodi]|uniref:MFS transporter n=1 Tax=Asaia platycodi TaxID=610243 RepID=UPI0004711A96|nr:MFS transporter [Asaia platycodi]
MTGSDQDRKRVIMAACVGNFLEFYNFMAYAFFAPMIAKAFFPDSSGLTGLFEALITFGAGFFLRPLGAFCVGIYARRYGHQAALMLTFAIMATGSLLLAATPSTRSIGMTAALLIVLARMLQGFSDGGEVGPATAMLYDAAPPGKGGVISIMQYVTQLLGMVVAVIFGLVLSLTLSHDALYAWGWRIPFFIGIAILPFGFWLRRQIPAQHAHREEPHPFGATLRLLITPKILLVFALIVCGTITNYLRTFGVSYAIAVLHLSPGTAMLAMALGLVCGVIAVIAGMRIAHRNPDPKLFVIVASIIGTPLCMLYYTLSVTYPGLGTQIGLNLTVFLSSGLLIAPVWRLLFDAIPNHSRAFIFGLVYAVAVSVFGGLTQPLTVLLIAHFHDPMVPAWMLGILMPLSLLAYLALRRRMIPPAPDASIIASQADQAF